MADVSIQLDAPGLEPYYSYLIPINLVNDISLGMCVAVPFGSRMEIGYICKVYTLDLELPHSSGLKFVNSIIDGAVTFSEQQFQLAQFIAERNLCTIHQAIRCIAPALMASKIVRWVRINSDSLRDTYGTLTGPQKELVANLLALGGKSSLPHLQQANGKSSFPGTFRSLIKRRIILEEQSVYASKTKDRTVTIYRTTPQSESVTIKVSAAGERILNSLRYIESQGASPPQRKELLEVAAASSQALKTLEFQGLIASEKLHSRRVAFTPSNRSGFRPKLNAVQDKCVSWINDRMDEHRTVVALLHGVTASGKTEVYLHAIESALAAGGSALVLVPEIALTSQIAATFCDRFGDEVAVLHSALSEGERHDEWKRIQNAKARIVIGARSAVFAPMENLRIVVVDEEHETSYKQDSTPRYHARDVAIERARLSNAVTLLGSATPSVESYFAAQSGIYHLLEMPDRIANRPMPAVELIDMRAEMRVRKSLFSSALEERLNKCIARSEQAILLLNRRGYSQFVLCRDCGFVPVCDHCAISLTLHAANNSLVCHHCGFTQRPPSLCPTCKSDKLRGFGVGTERVETELQMLFPNIKISRMDRDTTMRKNSHQNILDAFRNREFDVLIGTQMVAKGLDFPNVTVVGVISADTGLHIPDFRSAERTFQLLTQVAGRAGRGENPGAVVIQSFTPDHFALQFAINHDYASFYAEEIENREELQYPPFRRMANLIAHHPFESTARDQAQLLANALRSSAPPEIEVIGPSPASMARLRDEFRWQVSLRAETGACLSKIIAQCLSNLKKTGLSNLTVDIDPY